MVKTCIFCGNPPNKKNKEHVIPKWLLLMTGNPSRKVTIGYDFDLNQSMSFEWLRFSAPSCTSCNEEYGKHESSTTPIMAKLIDRAELAPKEVIILLDWLDKVRIGLWLCYYFLENNKASIIPHLCINDRLGTKDRWLQVHFLESRSKQMGINPVGSNSFVFQFSPSCFALRINDLILINASGDFVVSRNCGFPFPKNLVFTEEGQIELEGISFERKTSNDFFGLRKHNKGVLTIAQPIHTATPLSSDFYSDQYMIDRSIDIDNRVGGLFRILDGNLQYIDDHYSPIEYESVLGAESRPIGELFSKVFEYQNVILGNQVKVSGRAAFEKAIAINNETSKYLASLHNNQNHQT